MNKIEIVESNVKSTVTKKPWYKKWYIILTIIIFIAMTIFNFNYTLVCVSGNSMNPNFTDGNVLLAERNYNQLYRFDVVVISSNNAHRIVIKRIIGLPGDIIEYKDNQLFVNGEYVEDIYGSGITNDLKITVDKDKYFCLGDNREKSNDSRKYGLFSKDEIFAKVQTRRYVKLQTNPIY